MPIRHRKHLTRPNERKCPKDLHAKLRDPKCRKEMLNTRDPQPEPPKPPGPKPPGPKPPGPTPPTPIPWNPIPPFNPATPYPYDIPNMGGGGLTWQDKLAISGAATVPAEIGVGATLISRGVAARAAAARAAAAQEAEATQADLGGGVAEAEIDTEETALLQGPATTATAAGEGTEMGEIGAAQAAGTQAEREATLASARAAAATTPKTAGVPGDVELTEMGGSGSAEAGEAGEAGAVAARGALPTVGPTGEASGAALGGQFGGSTAEAAALTGGEETTPLLAGGTGAAESAAISGATEGAVEGGAIGGELAAESTGLALGPEAIPAVAAMVAVTALVSFGPDIIKGIGGLFSSHTDWYNTMRDAKAVGSSYGKDYMVPMLNAAARMPNKTQEEKDQQQAAFKYIENLTKADEKGLNIVKWEDKTTGKHLLTAQKSTADVAKAIAKYQRNPNAFLGQDPRVLAIEGLSPIMAYGANGAVLNKKTGFYEPVRSYDQVKNIDTTMKLTTQALLKETGKTNYDDMFKTVEGQYMNTSLLPDHDAKPGEYRNPYLSEMGNNPWGADNSSLSTQAGIMKAVGTKQSTLDYIAKGAILPATGAPKTASTSSSAPTGDATAPTTGSQSNQKPATTTTTSAAATTGGTTTQKPVAQQGTATAPEAQVAQKTQNK